MPTEQQKLEAAILALEGQRALLGGTIADAALAPLRAKLADLIRAQPIAEDQKLKQVTIMFLDVVGSTTMSQDLDPEEIFAVMNGTLERCTAIVVQHHGKVLQYAGDNLLAVFGADQAREDDAVRAVKAGLALLEEGKRQGALVRQRHGHDGFDVRVGLHTGGVLLGGGVDAESGIRGLAVNVAARMEQTAPAGALRISHDTYAQVRGVFDVEPQPPIAVKGVDEPIVTYLVQRTKPRAFRVTTRGIEGVETRMVGRDVELEELQEAFKRLYRDDAGLGVVTVVADAGLGKSRLLYEFQNWAEARAEAFYIFQGRAQPQTQSQPYGLLRDILAWRLQIADDDSMADAKRKIEQGIVPLFQAEDGDDLAEAHAHLLGHLVGLDFAESRHIRGIRDDGKQIRNRGFHAAAQVFRRVVARDGLPIVLLLDDLHWADDGSLDFLNYLTQVNRDVPMLLLGLSRPTLFERRADWPSMAGAQRIDLSPLDRNASRQLAKELLKKLAEVPAALRELITGGAEGNPFYMEELVKMLVDEGAIVTGGERWTVVPDKLLATKVPPTLTGVLQARLDSLPPTERLALQQASVVGLVFWDQALAAIDAAAPEALPSLAKRELALPQAEAALSGMREYAFKHQILHQVTYETVLKRARRDLHGRAARWFAGLTDARAADFLAVAAQHYAQAGEAAAACEHYTRAAEHARTRHANAATLDLVEKALALLPEVPASDRAALHWRLLDARERTFDLKGRRDEQGADLDALDGLAAVSGDRSLQAEVAFRRARRVMRMGDLPGQKAASQLSHDLALAADDVPRRLQAQRLLAASMGMLGDVAAGRVLAEAGLDEARALGLTSSESNFLNALAVLALLTDDLAGYVGFVRQDLEINLALGDRRNEMMARFHLAIGWSRFGLFGRARDEASEALRLARALGDRYFEGSALAVLSETALLQGEDTQALALAEAALAIAAETQARDSEIEFLLALGDAELALGRTDAAEVSFQRAETLAVEIGRFLAVVQGGRARVALAQADPTMALDRLAPILTALEVDGTIDDTDNPHLTRLTCWRALNVASDPRAAWMLDLAYQALQKTAAAISDAELRHSFLTNHPTNRTIVAAWEAARSG